MSFRKHRELGGLREPPGRATPGLDATVTPAGILTLPAPRAAHAAKATRDCSETFCGPFSKPCRHHRKGSFLRLSASRGKNARYSLKLGNFSSKLHYPLGAARKPLASFQGIVETCVHNERNPNKSGGKIYTDYKQESNTRVYAALEHSYLNMSVSMHSSYYLLHP